MATLRIASGDLLFCSGDSFNVPIQDFMYLTEPTPMPEPMLTTLPLP